MSGKQQTNKEIRNEVPSFLLFLSAAFSLMFMILFPVINNYLEHKFVDAQILVIVIASLSLGIIMCISAMKTWIKESERMDVQNYLGETDNSKINLQKHYEEYCKTLKLKGTKKKSNDGYKSYEEWFDSVREAYKKQIEEEQHKKETESNSVRGFTLDQKQSLKFAKRRVEHYNDSVKTILIPTMLGLIAIVCSGGVNGELYVIVSSVASSVMFCFVSARMLTVNQRVSDFIEDFATAVEIDLDV